MLVPFPYSDLSSTKKRPVLIISNSDFNQIGSDVVCCMITSKPTVSKYAVVITGSDVADGYLAKASVVKAGRLLTIDKSVVINRFGTLSEEKSKEVIEKIKEIVELRRSRVPTQVSLP